MTRAEDENDGQATERVVIRDRRKINPNGKAKASEGSVSQDEKAKEPVGGAHRAADPDEGAEHPGEPAAQRGLAVAVHADDHHHRRLAVVTLDRERADRTPKQLYLFKSCAIIR